MISDINTRKFVFSRQQLADKQETAARIDMVYTPGKVMVNGKERDFTEILLPEKESKYKDATVVTIGSIRTLRIVPEKTE